MEDFGFTVIAAHELVPALLPTSGVLTKTRPADSNHYDAEAGASCVVKLGEGDIGQACIIRNGMVVAVEDAQGTEFMIRSWKEEQGLTLKPNPETKANGILFKAPKPDQDRRADVPLIGLETAMQAAEAGLAGIVIEAQGVMVLDLDGVIACLDRMGMFLWVREKETS